MILQQAAALAVAMFAPALAPALALATDRYYLGPDAGTWNTAANWNTAENGSGANGVPAPTDNVFIRGSVSKTVDFDGENYTPGNGIAQLTIDSTGTATLTLTQSGNMLISDNEQIGVSGAGVYAQSGGTHTLVVAGGGVLKLGVNAASSGTYQLSGAGAVLSAAEIDLGYFGTGTFVQSGGGNSVTTLSIADQIGSKGNYTFAAGTLNAARIDVGRRGDATFTQTGGNLTVASGAGLFIGTFGTSTGTVTLNGASANLTTNNAYVGGSDTAAGGVGVLNIQNGSMTVTGTLKVWDSGDNAPSGTRVNLAGGTLTVGALDLSANPARFNFNGGTLATDGAINAGGQTFVMNAGTLQTVTPGATPSFNAGTFDFKGGNVTPASGLRLYNASLNFDGGSSGTFVFRTSGSLVGTVPASSTVIVQGNGESPAGNFVFAGSPSGGGNAGTITLTSEGGAFGAGVTRASNSGVINIDGGSGGTRSIGSGSAAAFINTGIININADTSISPTVAQSGGTINIAPGKMLTASGDFVMTGGTLAADGVNPGDGGALAFSAPAPDNVLDFKGGSVTGTGLRLYHANLQFDGGSNGTFILRTSSTDDSIALGSGITAIPAGATIIAQGSPDSPSGVNLDLSSAPANNGTLRLTSTGGVYAATLGTTVDTTNAGTIDVQAGSGGTRAVNGPATNSAPGAPYLHNSGNITIGAGVTLNIGGNFALEPGGAINTGTGTALKVSNAIFNFKGGSITGAAPASLYGSTLKFDATSGGSSTFVFRTSGSLVGTIPAGATVIIQGNNESPSGNFVFAGSPSAGGNNGVITLSSVDGAYGAGVTRATNAGIINIDPGTGGTRSIGTGTSDSFVNTGTINVNVDATISPTVSQSGGTIKIAPGVTLSTSGNFTLTAGTVDSDGVNAGDGGSLSFSAPVPDNVLDFQGGSVTGSGLRLYHANLKFDGGSSGTFILRTNSGDDNITLGSGVTAIPAAATVIAQGSIDSPSGVNLDLSSAPANNGTLRLTSIGGIYAATLGTTVDTSNAGTIDVQAGTGGTRAINGPATNSAPGAPYLHNSGNITIGAGVSLTIGGNFAMESGGHINTASAASLRFTDSILDFKGGQITGSAPASLYNSTLKFDGGGSSSTFVFRTSGSMVGTVPAGATVTVQGNNESASGNFVIAGGSSGGGNNGTITVTSVDGVYGAGVTRASNAGIININPGTGGTRSIGSGTAASFINTGTININTDASISPTVAQSGGIISIAPGKTLTTSGTFTMTGGTLAADGVSPGDGGALNFGSPAPDNVLDFQGGSVTGSGLRLYNANLKYNGGSSGTFVFRSGGDITLGGSATTIPAAANVIIQGNSDLPAGFSVNAPESSSATLTVTSAGGSFPVTLVSSAAVMINNGTINVDNGTFRNEGFIHFGESSGDTGTLNLSSNGTVLLPTTSTVGGREFIGYGGTGVVNQSGGINQDANMLILGELAGSHGTYNLTGGTLNDQREFVGDGGTGTLTQTAGSHTAARFLVIANLPGSTGTFNLSGGSYATPTATINTAGAFHWNSGTFGPTHLTISGGLFTMAATGAGTKVLRAQDLTINAGGKLDVGDNKVIVNTLNDVGSATGGVYNGISGLIQSGRNNGSWNGPGIITSQSTAAAGSLTSIGVAFAQEIKGVSYTDTAIWAGETVTGNDTLVMYTYGGDANLDGKLNVDDYGRIDFAVPLGIAGWSNGDFNYDGKINVDDYGIIDFNVGIQGAAFFAGPEVAATPGVAHLEGVSSVPEPTISTIPLLAGALTLRRRSRRRKTSGA